MNRFFIAAALIVAALAATRTAASADAPSTTIDLSISNGALRPASTYGPWQFATISARSIVGADKPGVALVARRDGDALAPSHGTSLSFDDYHQFSPRAYGYVSVQAASGTIFPTRSAYAEFDGAVREGLAIGAGGGISVDATGLLQRYASLGPTLYFPHGNATLRYLPIWTQGQVGASSWLGDLSYGDEGRTIVSLHVQDGVAPAFAVDDPTVASGFQDRSFVVGATVRRWFSPRLGMTAGLEYGSERDRATGVAAYSRTTFSLGLFVGVGHAAVAP